MARWAAWTGLLSLLAFGALTAFVVRSGSGILPTDAPTLDWALRNRPAAALTAARALTSTGNGTVPYVLAAIAGALSARGLRGRLLSAAAFLAFLGAGQALRYATMTLIARPRPPVRDWATHASGWSFPSGHTATAAITAGLLITAVLLRSPRGKRTAVALIACWGASVGLTRPYLGVHWFTDVIGGWLFAVSWLSLGACLLLRLLPPRTPTVPAPAPSP
ncbi:phosphatase PAP2 family protein [Streptomyces sp. NPDC088725]|uniref:phosphatase PAP2 family protein n=1 Tax=Streptomyces sp. NPDC088725 TaxID=3365873 RepID=UPI0038280AC5